ncbi:MAG TPA: DNA primase catalytic subunit PriS [Methanocorpusculum sp.]|nr:DNA primase catalytic subunit PriS [Methanocorpusculum sp.]
MKPATLEYLKKRFYSYYNGEIRTAGAVYIPDSLAEREWGFLYFSADKKSGMRRHVSFTSREEVDAYLRSMAPAHVYYSTAYYANPGAATMQEKEWRGADLIFDLDADHIVRASYDVMLARVKEEMFKLIDMLTGELGFQERDLKINFSGGRGYHIHIPGITVRGWSSNERRELVNYVSGTGLSYDAMMQSKAKSGWPKRYREAVLDELTRIKGLSVDDAKAYLCGIGVSERSAGEFYKHIDDTRGVFVENPSLVAGNIVLKKICNAENKAFQDHVLARAAQADEPVTTDIKRLIRHPGSLHGGSGMRVTPLSVRELADFDPLVDAVVFSEGRLVSVDCSFPLSMTMFENTYELCAGKNTVPEALAVFLCARGIAELAGGT